MHSKHRQVEFNLDQKKKKNQFSNEHRLTSVDPIEISLLLMIRGHQKKAYFSRID
jgi:hypothetical protein